MHFRVATYADGEAAFKSLENDLPDLILSDVMMPKLDGFQFLEKIRNDPKTKMIPFLFLSARSGEESRIEGLKRGANDYLVKPFISRELLAKVKSHLEIARIHRETTAYLFDFFMQAPVALVILDGPDHFFTLANPVYEKFVGREVIGKKVVEAYTQEEAGKFIPLLDAVYQTGEPFIGKEIPLNISNQQGIIQQQWIDVAYHPFRRPDGSIQGILAVLQDVTDQVRARNQIEAIASKLHEADRLLKLALRSGKMGSWRITFPENKLIGDELFREFHNARDNEDITSAIERIGHPEDRLKVKQALENSIKSGVPYYCEYRILNPDGTYRWTQARGEPLINEKGEVTMISGTAVDIDEAKRFEIALQSSKEVAESAVQKLEQVIQDLGHERELRERFVATLTHDLRNPLMAAKMGAQLVVKNAGLSENVYKLSGKIIENLSRADQMISNLLDANRIQAGEKLPTKIEACDLNQIVSDTIEELVTEHGDRFILKSDSKIEGYWSDIGIRRILENICSNAIKYGEGDGKVTVSLNRVGEQVRIDIHNKGFIPKEDQEMIFTQYRRTKSATQGFQKGWGLGLTLVKGIAEAHGGNVRVESSPQTGTNFIVHLPMDSRHQE